MPKAARDEEWDFNAEPDEVREARARWLAHAISRAPEPSCEATGGWWIVNSRTGRALPRNCKRWDRLLVRGDGEPHRRRRPAGAGRRRDRHQQHHAHDRRLARRADRGQHRRHAPDQRLGRSPAEEGFTVAFPLSAGVLVLACSPRWRSRAGDRRSTAPRHPSAPQPERIAAARTKADRGERGPGCARFRSPPPRTNRVNPRRGQQPLRPGAVAGTCARSPPPCWPS